MFRATTKKDEDGFPAARVHMDDAGHTRLLVTLDVESPFAVIHCSEFCYLEFSPHQLRALADWVEAAWITKEAWLRSPEGQQYIQRLK